MATPVTIPTNYMPVPTWNRLKANGVDVVIPAAVDVPEPEYVVFKIPEGAGLGWFERTIEDNDHHEVGDTTLVGTFDRTIDEIESTLDWQDGVGDEMANWLHAMSTRRLFVRVPDGMQLEEPIAVKVAAHDGTATVACLGLIAGANSSVRVNLHVDGEHDGVGVAGASLRIIAAEGAQICVNSIQTLDGGFKHVDNIGALLSAGARLEVDQTVLGGVESYTGMACDLVGDEAACKVDTRYLGHESHKIDFNYAIRQRGKSTTCELLANGVLMDESSKTLRGTIDMINGCSGSVGTEHENVLLLSDKASNKSIPVILCDEDDVQGSHGASIGHVNPEQLGYLQSRGLSIGDAEIMFASAAFDYAADHAFDDEVREAVWRLGEHALKGYKPQRNEVD